MVRRVRRGWKQALIGLGGEEVIEPPAKKTRVEEPKAPTNNHLQPTAENDYSNGWRKQMAAADDAKAKAAEAAVKRPQSGLDDYYTATDLKRAKIEQNLEPMVVDTKSDGEAASAVTSTNQGGSTTMSGNQEATGESIPYHVRSDEKTYTFSTTRSWYFESAPTSTATVTDTNMAPYGYPQGNSGTKVANQFTDWNGELNLPWKIIPNNHLSHYLSPNDFKTLYSDGAYAYKVEGVRIKGYDAVLIQDNAVASGVQTSIEKPQFMEYTDMQHVFQNQGRTTTVGGTDLQPREYTPNPRVIDHENNGNLLAEPRELNGLKYWIPGPKANWTATADIIKDYYPQVERIGGFRLVKPGEDIHFAWTPEDKGWNQMYAASGEAILSLSAGQMIDPRAFGMRVNTHTYPRLISAYDAAGHNSEEDRHNVTDSSSRYGKPMPVWCVRVPEYTTVGDTVIKSRIFMMFDYEITISVKCRDNHVFFNNRQITYTTGGFPANDIPVAEDTTQCYGWYV